MVAVEGHCSRMILQHESQARGEEEYLTRLSGFSEYLSFLHMSLFSVNRNDFL